MMENTNNVRGLSSWEYILLKEILSEKLTFKVNIKHHKETYNNGSVTIKPTKNEERTWNKEQLQEVRTLLETLGAEYTREGVSENTFHSVFSNGISHLKFLVDKLNCLLFPGLVPNICVKHMRSDTRNAAEKFKEKNTYKFEDELFIGMHPKDGFVVYSVWTGSLIISQWEVTEKADIVNDDIWSKCDLGYHYRFQSFISGFTPVNGINEIGIEYSYDRIMLFSYLRATGTELIEHREYIPWCEREIRGVKIPSRLVSAAEVCIAESPPLVQQESVNNLKE